MLESSSIWSHFIPQNNTDHALSSEELYQLAITVCVTATLSLLGSSFIIFTFVLFKEVRRELGAQLIFFLNLSDFCMSFSWFPWWGNNKSTIICTIQATTLQYFEIASVLWAFCIALTLVLFFNREDVSPRMSLYHVLCWTVPIPIVGSCYYLNLFGDAGATWCWVKDPQYRFFVYIPCLLLCLANFILFLYIIYKSSGESSSMYVLFRRKIYAYLAASFVCVLPALANRLQNFIQPSNQMFILFFLQALFQPLQGCINSLIYGLTDDHYIAQYRKWKCFRRLAPTALSINAEEGDDEEHHPLALDFDYENESYRSFSNVKEGNAGGGGGGTTRKGEKGGGAV